MAGYVEAIINGQKTAYIDGAHGPYDGKVKNKNVRYGRNAAANLKAYSSYSMPKTQDLPDLKNLSALDNDQFEKTLASLDKVLAEGDSALDSMPSLPVTLKYMPGKPNYLSLNTAALLGAAFEEMGKRPRVQTSELTEKLRKAFAPYTPLDTSHLTEKEREILGSLPAPKIPNSSKLSADALDIDEDGFVDIAEYAASILSSDILSKGQNPFANFSPDKIDGTITQEGMNKLLSFFSRKNKTVAKERFAHLHDFFKLDKCMHKFIADTDNIQQ